MALAPLAAQDVDVATFLRDLRAQSDKAAAAKPSDREILALLTKRLEDAPAGPRKADIYLEIAHLQRLQGDPAAGIASLRKAKELQPENRRIPLQLAEATA
jgi:hypothetical protein